MSVRMDGGGRNAREVPAGAPAQKEKSDSLEEQLKARTYNVLLSRLATMVRFKAHAKLRSTLNFEAHDNVMDQQLS